MGVMKNLRLKKWPKINGLYYVILGLWGPYNKELYHPTVWVYHLLWSYGFGGPVHGYKWSDFAPISRVK